MPAIHQQWWESLSPQWQQAFSLCVLQKQTAPTANDFAVLQNLQVLRIAGPQAPHSNFSTALTDLSGITALSNLQILIVSHCDLISIQEVSVLKNLKALFLFNNKIESLKGVESLTQLEQLYVNSNQLVSIEEVEQLLNLEQLNVADNKLTSLKGLVPAHEEKLKKFYCKPNDHLRQKEIIYAERELGIICH
ncbi:MAG: leucine-rich repeat domain-containing protein [Chitinophagaceae bacterium]|nr:MAG: leucine-rich repeat domain-containing protein [Chitinophagaceae bacterium]